MISTLLLRGSYVAPQNIIILGALAVVVLGMLVFNIVLGAKARKASKTKKVDSPVVACQTPAVEVACTEVDTLQAKEEESVLDKNGNDVMVKLNRSFTAKLIQTSQETKEFFVAIKNYLLSFKGVKCRISWNAATFNAGRKQLAKLTVKGKTLNLNVALNPDDYADAKFNVFDMSDSTTYANVPLAYKVKSNRAVNNSKKLIDDLVGSLALAKIECVDVAYASDYPYEDNDALIAKGLIKVKALGSEEINENDNLVVSPFSLAKNKMSEAGDDLFSGIGEIEVRYNRSFLAKLIQSNDETKDYYCQIKNYLLSFKQIKCRVSWKGATFNVGRKQIAKLTIRGKTLHLHLPLTADDLDDIKFKVLDMSEIKAYESVPLGYRVKSSRGVSNAKKLLDRVFATLELTAVELSNPDTVSLYPYEDTNALLEKGLIKVKSILGEEITEDSTLVAAHPFEIHQRVTVEEANAEISDEVALTLAVHNETTKSTGKKFAINIDVLSANFNDGDTVNIEALKEKGLVPKGETAIKILARGSLDKKLIVEANSFSVEAIKMIVLVGGTAIYK